MRNFNNWYWVVAQSDTQVFSSASGTYVPLADATYQAWLGGGFNPSVIVSEDELIEVLGRLAPGVFPTFPAGLSAYAANARYNKETGGITVSGIAVPTDRQTQAQLTGAFNYVGVTPSATIQWKLADGAFVALDAAQITAIATAVAVHVQACFAAEATLYVGIAASPPTITTFAQIDAAFAAITT